MVFYRASPSHPPASCGTHTYPTGAKTCRHNGWRFYIHGGCWWLLWCEKNHQKTHGKHYFYGKIVENGHRKIVENGHRNRVLGELRVPDFCHFSRHLVKKVHSKAIFVGKNVLFLSAISDQYRSISNIQLKSFVLYSYYHLLLTLLHWLHSPCFKTLILNRWFMFANTFTIPIL